MGEPRGKQMGQKSAKTRETRVLFSHADADTRFGASVFWVRRGILPESEVGGFLDFWQTRRDGGKRGIVEVIS